MKQLRYTLIFILSLLAIASQAEIITYPWPSESELINNAKFTFRVRQINPSGTNGEWMSIPSLYSFQRSYADHWKVGGDAGTDVMSDRSLTFASFAFTGIIEVEITQKISSQNAKRVEISPKAFGFNPNYFDGKTVRFQMNAQKYVSVNFDFGALDKTINRDDNRASGYDIRHGCMILADLPEEKLSDGYPIPKPTDPGVVVWDNNTNLSTILNANIIYFPAGEHIMRDHKDRWERNSSWDKSEAAGNVVITKAQYDATTLYRGRLFLGKTNQKVYLAPGAIVYGGFHSDGNKNNWIYGRGIVTGRKHLMHEIVKPDATVAETTPYKLITQTKEAFCYFGDGAVYDGITFLEAWHHTCPSGKNTTIKRSKIIGWCSNNDGMRPGSGSKIDKVFIKTSDDYDYARDPHTVKNGVFWPGVNGAVGQLGWNNLGTGYAEYYNTYIINSEWHESTIAAKANIGIINGGKASAGIKLQNNIYQDMYIENRTNFLASVKTSGTASGFLKNFKIKNITTEYPFSNPAGVLVKQEMRGSGDTWVEDWVYTNVFIDGKLLTWDNYKNYFNLNLIGSNGNNTDDAAKCRNVTFNTEGEIYEITYSYNSGGNIRPVGTDKKIQVAAGMDQTIKIAPNDGFRIKSITVDGNLEYEYNNTNAINRKDAWVFFNVLSNHTIDVAFEAGDDFFDFEGNIQIVPSVHFISPEPNTNLNEPASIDVEVAASIAEGASITGVTLFIDETEISTLTEAPYQWLASSNTHLKDLIAGNYVLKAIATADNGKTSIDLVTIKVSEPTSSLRIEAESFISVSTDIQTEACSDEGAGQNIGFIKTGSYANYEVTIPQTGEYKVSFRCASQKQGGSIQLKQNG